MVLKIIGKSNALWCRNICKYEEKKYITDTVDRIVWLQQTVFPELHARDVAMKWVYFARRQVCGT